jgi:ribonuclease HII
LISTVRYIVGVDEVGRGPLAGPVSVGIVVIPRAHDISQYFAKLTDSKQMTEKAREAACVEAELLQKNGTISYGVFSSSAEQIDEWGIEAAISVAIVKGITKLAPNHEECEVFLDGRLKAPKEYKQQAIIRGDSLIPAISLAKRNDVHDMRIALNRHKFWHLNCSGLSHAADVVAAKIHKH